MFNMCVFWETSLLEECRALKRQLWHVNRIVKRRFLRKSGRCSHGWSHADFDYFWWRGALCPSQEISKFLAPNSYWCPTYSPLKFNIFYMNVFYSYIPDLYILHLLHSTKVIFSRFAHWQLLRQINLSDCWYYHEGVRYEPLKMVQRQILQVFESPISATFIIVPGI
jgi:hypothetical protein